MFSLLTLYSRCLNEIFFTWNESKDSLYDILNAIHAQDPRIRMASTMGDTIDYLDVNIGHLDGALKIQVAHDLDIEPYALPYVFGHPRHQYSTLPRAALMRAVRCCADVSRFANELEDLRLSFEYNGFEEDFFRDKLQLFLEEFDAVELNALQHGEAYYDQSLYDDLRQNVSNYNQRQKKATLKRLQRQTMSYRWKRTSNWQKKWSHVRLRIDYLDYYAYLGFFRSSSNRHLDFSSVFNYISNCCTRHCSPFFTV